MMFEVIPFKAPHLAAIRLQAAQMYLSEWVTEEQGAALEQSPSYTAMLDDVPIGAAGVIPIWTGRAMAWSFISDTGPQHFLKCHRAVKHFLDGCFVQRIEMTVDCDHVEAHRWAKMLGFTMEAERMKAYAPDGHDCALYSRVL
jgi:hypothetical protein